MAPSKKWSLSRRFHQRQVVPLGKLLFFSTKIFNLKKTLDPSSSLYLLRKTSLILVQKFVEPWLLLIFITFDFFLFQIQHLRFRFVIQLKINDIVSPVLAVATVANVCLDTWDSLIVKSVSVTATKMCAIRNQETVQTWLSPLLFA